MIGSSARLFHPLRALAALGVAFVVAGCGGGDPGGGGGGGSGAATLQRVEYGRLVDIYAYRIVDPNEGTDRRDTRNRAPFRIASDVVVNPAIESDQLFDSAGAARPTASYRFLPFDVAVGHEQLLILWDDRFEADRFDSAFAAATTNLVEVSAAFRGQNTLVRPIPVIPRNAAIKLTFDQEIGADTAFFDANPAAIQLLRFIDDPNIVPPTQAFEVASYRTLSDGGREVVLDTTVLGAEAAGGRTSVGLLPSTNQVNANYRIAIPTDGATSNTFDIAGDTVPQLNDVDSQGNSALIRDFRSGNPADGTVGALGDFEPPSIVAVADMAITAIDGAERILTLDKRSRNLAIRGRLPFVDGIVDPDSGLPQGWTSVPTVDENGNAFPLPSGDFVIQTVQSPTGESVRIAAEVIEVLEVGVVEGDATFAGPGLTANGTDGGELATVRVRVSNITSTDSAGNVVQMRTTADPAGGECDVAVRYYEFIRYGGAAGSAQVSDASRRSEFLVIDPEPASPTNEFVRREVLPSAGISLRFSEPMDLARVSATDNFVLTQQEATLATFQQVLAEPKSATLLFIAGRLIDASQNGTLLRLDAPLGHYHMQGQTEQYWFHVDLGSNGVVDLSGNTLQIYDLRPAGTASIGGETVEVPLQNFSQAFEMAASASDNLIASIVRRFASSDEDGTRPGSIDYFGQFQIRDGSLLGAEVSRKSRTADAVNLPGILRWNRGECVDTSVNPAVSVPPGGGLGPLYLTPSMIATQTQPPIPFQPPQGPQTFGGIVEPHTSRGARLQMTYREDDFGLGYHAVDEFNIDVEQLYWAPWNDSAVLFDRFDRYTMQLGHSVRRPDIEFVWDEMNMVCQLVCNSFASGLSTTFAENSLRGPELMHTVVKDKEYVINPNDAFRAVSGIKYVPYPRFESTYTWRDSRLVSYDMDAGQAIGLGGAENSGQLPPEGHRTASVSSPWVPDVLPLGTPGMTGPPTPQPLVAPVYVRDPGDFLGDRDTDHDPIALPLLVDISVWPDDTTQLANAGNLFHIAYVGAIWPGGPLGNGYYNATGICGTGVPAWPILRVYSMGGPDPNDPGAINLVTPDREMVARGGVTKDMGYGDGITGLFQTPGADDHLHWAQVDLVRRVSQVTSGFIDTLKPNQHDLDGAPTPLPAPLPPAAGRPDLSGINAGDVGVTDLITVFDPPAAVQPGGAKVIVELRGAEDFENATIYQPASDESFDDRGNLLNPNYACEAYRYSMVNAGPGGDSTPRVTADGLTPYVVPEALDTIRNPINGTLPRYMNYRLVLENNILSDPPGVPFLRSFSIVYRVAPR